jgi:hypothetical protein
VRVGTCRLRIGSRSVARLGCSIGTLQSGQSAKAKVMACMQDRSALGDWCPRSATLARREDIPLARAISDLTGNCNRCGCRYRAVPPPLEQSGHTAAVEDVAAADLSIDRTESVRFGPLVKTMAS